MAKEIAMPFPVKGINRNWAYAAQPRLTTPDALNVRSYSTDEERARGGSRPGIKPAYSQRLAVDRGAWATSTAYAIGDTFTNAGTRYYVTIAHTSGTFATDLADGKMSTRLDIAWLGYLDWGFGDYRYYADGFNYEDGPLNEAEVDPDAAEPVKLWPDADAGLIVASGYVRQTGNLPISSPIKSGEYSNFAGDTWEDFELNVDLTFEQWTNTKVTFWVAEVTESAAKGVLVSIAKKVEAWVTGGPGMGWGLYHTNTYEIVATSGSSGKRYTTEAPEVGGGTLRVLGTQETVDVYWNDALVVTVPREDGTCSCAGFRIDYVTNPMVNEPWNYPNGYCFVQIKAWSLIARTRQAGSIGRKLVGITRRVWAESSEGTIDSTAADTDLLADVALVQAAPYAGELYITDGTKPLIYNPQGTSTAIVRDWIARHGTIEPTATLIANWRNRIVIAGVMSDPQNWWMSRQDDPLDWDYGQDDAQAAMAGNFSQGGKINNPITAICPVNNNACVFGTETSLHVLRGDPASGGRVFDVSFQTGIAGPNAWCTDEEGTLYFFGQGGLFSFAGSSLKDITGKRLPEIGGLVAVKAGQAGANGQHFITLTYDVARMGINIFLTPFDITDEGEHWFYDLRNDAFWMETYPAAIGPTCACFYNATSQTYRRGLMAGRNGRLYTFDDGEKDDTVESAAAAIASHAWIGPYRLAGDVNDAVLTRLVVTMSKDTDQANYGVYASASPEEIFDATAASTGTLSDGRNSLRPRVRGGALAVRISNATAAKRWALESMAAEAIPGGIQR